MLNSKNALIVFVKDPDRDQVKTRLAKGIGTAKAKRIYKKLLQITKEVSLKVKSDVFIYYHSEINENDIWDSERFNKRNQRGKDLGERMKNAFLDLFNKGYENIQIIGSDCPKIGVKTIMDGFELLSLDDREIVIGPTYDGGYYLLGMNAKMNFLFEGIQWSTNSVCANTISKIEEHKKFFYLLPPLGDVDHKEDLMFFPDLA